MSWKFPIFVNLAGTAVTVVGAGAVAERKVSALLEAGARVTVVAPEVCPAIEGWADEGRLVMHRRAYRRGDLRGARLAYAATGDTGVNRAVREEALAEGVWLNAVDQPDLCDFITPSVLRRGDMTVAVSTNGRAPGLARQIREELEGHFPSDYGREIERAAVERERSRAAADGTSRPPGEGKGNHEDGRTRRHEELSFEPSRSSDGQRDEDKGNHEDGRTRRHEELGSGPSGLTVAGKVFLVGAGPGDIDLLTVKGLKLLRTADVVIYDALVDKGVLECCRPGARLQFVGKRDKHHTVPQERINELLVAEARAGHLVVRLKGGDPFIFGRGGEEAEALAEAGIPFEVVPGVSAGVGVPAYAGIPLTHRDFTSELVFVTGHECGKGRQPVDWKRYAQGSASLVIFMGVHSLAGVARRLLEHGRAADCPVAVIENGTTSAQRTVVAPLARIAEEAAAAGIQPPALIVVGDVVRLRDKVAWRAERASAEAPAGGGEGAGELRCAG